VVSLPGSPRRDEVKRMLETRGHRFATHCDAKHGTRTLTEMVSSNWSGGSCPTGTSLIIPLVDTHDFEIIAVDPGLSTCNGQNDPMNGGCQKALRSPIHGDSHGGSLAFQAN